MPVAGIRSFLVLLVLGLFVLPGSIRCKAEQPDGSLLRTEPYRALRPYEKLDEFGKFYYPRDLWEAARNQTEFVAEAITYASDGIEVPGLLYHPRQAPSTPQPVIVYCRGGMGDFGQLDELVIPDFYLWAKAGFSVVASDLRWHGPTARLDQWGGVELHDIFNLLPIIRSLKGLDPNRIYLIGQSRGGMMVYLALKRGFPAKAAVVMAGVTDLERLARERGDEFVKGDAEYDGWAKLWPDYATHAGTHLRERSAIHWADRISAPVLILHARNDPKVPVTDALNMALALAKADKPYSLHIFEKDGHSLPLNRPLRNQLIFDWMNRHS